MISSIKPALQTPSGLVIFLYQSLRGRIFSGLAVAAAFFSSVRYIRLMGRILVSPGHRETKSSNGFRLKKKNKFLTILIFFAARDYSLKIFFIKPDKIV